MTKTKHVSASALFDDVQHGFRRVDDRCGVAVRHGAIGGLLLPLLLVAAIQFGQGVAQAAEGAPAHVPLKPVELDGGHAAITVRAGVVAESHQAGAHDARGGVERFAAGLANGEPRTDGQGQQAARPAQHQAGVLNQQVCQQCEQSACDQLLQVLSGAGAAVFMLFLALGARELVRTLRYEWSVFWSQRKYKATCARLERDRSQQSAEAGD